MCHTSENKMDFTIRVLLMSQLFVIIWIICRYLIEENNVMPISIDEFILDYIRKQSGTKTKIITLMKNDFTVQYIIWF